MTPKQTAFLAVALTSYIAACLAWFTHIPEFIEQVVVGIEVFLASGFVLVVLFRTPWFKTHPPERQRRAIWWTAGITSGIVCFYPIAIWLFKL